MIFDFHSPPNQISINKQGGKFFYLYQLSKIEDINIPLALCISEPEFDRAKLSDWLSPTNLYAVRSSANQEDIPEYTAAGVFTSYLNLSGAESIFENIEHCFLSANSEKAKQYFASKGISTSQLKLSVIVQEMVPAEISGVLFTVNPVSAKDELYIQLVSGVAEKLVSGQVNPATEIVRKDEPPAGDLFRELWKAALLIEKTFRSPQDIEWAWYQKKLYILQARPLDIRPKTYPAEQVWTRANIAEIIPKPLTPLSWEIFKQVLFRAYRTHYYSLADRIFTNIIHLLPRSSPALASPKMFSGYLYLNLDTIFRSFGLEPWVSNEVLQAGLGFSVPQNSQPVRLNIWDRWYTHIKKLIFRIELLFPFISMEKRVPKFIQNQMHKISVTQNISHLDMLIKKIQFLFGWHLAVTSRTFCHLGFLFNKYRAQGKQSALLTALVRGLSQNQMNSYTSDLEKMASGRISETQFLKKYGHRSVNEFELSHPPWQDQPAFLESIINQKSKTVLRKTLNTAGEKLEISTRERKAFQQAVHLREELKSELIRHYRQLRTYYLGQAEILRSEGLLEKTEHIFFLKKDEIKMLFQHRINMSQEIFRRQINFEKNSAQKVPNHFNGTELADFYNPNLPKLGEYKGIGCSEGIVSGSVLLVSTFEDTARVKDDHIVITRSADPGWTPVLLKCRGLVAEVGGILSHIATIARENNVPMIVGIENISSYLQNGQQITIDGSTGKLSVHRD